MQRSKFFSPKKISVLVSGLILLVLYSTIDFVAFLNILFDVNASLFFFGIFLVIPITLLVAFRLNWLSSENSKIGYIESLKLVLAASVMNLVLPAKMGDIFKSSFMTINKNNEYENNVALVMFEKICDLLALLLCCFFGLLVFEIDYSTFILLFIIISFFIVFCSLSLLSETFSIFIFKLIWVLIPQKYENRIRKFQDAWLCMNKIVLVEKNKFVSIFIFSVLLWLCHLFQIWIFILSLGVMGVTFLNNLAITPVAIFSGLLPLTFAGIGVRDLAFIYFYAPYFSSSIGAALGTLATLRYILPALFGIPFFIRYLRLKDVSIDSKG